LSETRQGEEGARSDAGFFFVRYSSNAVSAAAEWAAVSPLCLADVAASLSESACTLCRRCREMPHRNIHAAYEAKKAGKAHGYCGYDMFAHGV
jgi:hypothetical protein